MLSNHASPPTHPPSAMSNTSTWRNTSDVCYGIVLSPLRNDCSPKYFFCCYFPGPWKISWKFNTPLINSTPLLNIVTNGIGLRGSYDIFVMPPVFEVLWHHAKNHSSSMSNNDLSSVLLRSLYDWRKGTKIPQRWSRFQDTKHYWYPCILNCTVLCLEESDGNILSKIRIWKPSIGFYSLPKVLYTTFHFTCFCNK